MRLTFAIIVIAINLNGKAFSQLPTCRDSFPSSLLLNNSFEEYSGCSAITGYEGGRIDAPVGTGGITVKNWRSFSSNTWEVHYKNYDCRTNQFNSIFDTADFVTDQPCSYNYPKAPMPLPDGKGFIVTFENDLLQSANENQIVKNYITSCLSQPLYAGQTYLLTFYLAFGTTVPTKCPQGYPTKSQSPYGVAIFGRQDCPGYPLKVAAGTPELMGGCLANSTGWVQLGRITLKGYNEWVTGAIEFTPTANIACIGVGPDCSNHSYDRDYYGMASMHYMDKLVLAPIADFSFRTIKPISGNVCDGHFALQAPAYGAGTYQWYKDGVQIPGATSKIYTVPDKPDAAGNYVVNISLPYNTCVNSLPFQVRFSNLNNFSLGNDTLLCTPAFVTLDATHQTATKYLWQDGSNKPSLSIDKSGLYWVQLEDENGCTKRDSIKVTVQGCDECRLFIPSAFTPNDDGLNDVFKVRPQCANIGLQNFNLRIYNRWGQLLFTTNDINKGWNGTYKGVKLNSDVFVYFVDYSFKKEKPLQQKGTVAILK